MFADKLGTNITLFVTTNSAEPNFDVIMISYGCLYKRNSKPVIKDSRVKIIATATKELKR